MGILLSGKRIHTRVCFRDEYVHMSYASRDKKEGGFHILIDRALAYPAFPKNSLREKNLNKDEYGKVRILL
jgi:hypothetical protein